MTSASINVTSSAEPEVDGWSRDEPRWRWCWSVHVYGFGVMFLADCLLCLFLSSVRKTSRERQSTMGRLLSSTLLLYSLLRSLLLLIDPYNSHALLPCTVFQLINTLVFPCMVLSLVLLDRTLLRLVQPSADAHVRAVTVFSSGYFGFVGALVVVVCRRSSFRHWVLLHQGLFVTCGTVLCCLVASKCLRLHRYARRTAVARRQIVAFIRSKRQSNSCGGVTNIRRIRRLKMDEAEHDDEEREKKGNGKNDAETSIDSSSNSSTESLETEVVTRNQSKFEILFSRRSHAYAREKKTLKEQGSLKISARSSLLENNSSDEDESDEVEQLEGALDVSSEMTPAALFHTFVLVNGEQKLFAKKKERKLPQSTNRLSKKPRNVSKNEKIRTFSTYERDPFRKKDELLSGTNVCAHSNTAYLFASASDVSELGVIVESPDAKPVSFEKPCDKDESSDAETEFDSRDGYLADTEIDAVTLTSEMRDLSCQLSDNTGPCSLNSQEEQTMKCSKSIFPLPTQERFLGLHRILIGCRLKGVLRLTCCVLISVVCIIALQVYEMVAPFGAPSNRKLRVTWSWLLFQTLSRLCELVFVKSTLAVVNFSARPRNRASSSSSDPEKRNQKNQG